MKTFQVSSFFSKRRAAAEERKKSLKFSYSKAKLLIEMEIKCIFAEFCSLKVSFTYLLYF